MGDKRLYITRLEREREREREREKARDRECVRACSFYHNTKL